MHGPNLGPHPGKRTFRAPQIEWCSGAQIRARFQKLIFSASLQVLHLVVASAVVGPCSTPLLCLLSLVRGTSNTYRAESTMAEAEEGDGPRLITLRDGFGAWGDVPALLRSEIFKWLPRRRFALPWPNSESGWLAGCATCNTKMWVSEAQGLQQECLSRQCTGGAL